MFNTILLTVVLCLLPVSELRGGLPYALSHGIDLVPAFFLCVVVNALLGPVIFLFLSTLHRILYTWRFYQNIFDKVVKRARNKLAVKVEKYGYWGLVLFVGIPLPVTGAVTGALGAWVLGMKPNKSFLFITVGIVLAGIIVSGVYFLVADLGIKALKIFIKI